MDEATKKLLEALGQSVKDLHEAVKAKFSSANPAQVETEKDALAQRVLDLEKQLKAMQQAKAIQKMVFAVAGTQVGEGSKAVTFSDFMRAVARGDQEILAHVKSANGQSEGTNADGGFVVPTEFATQIIALERTFGLARRIASLIPMGTLTRKVPRQLTHPTVTWTDEAVNHTKTKVTLEQMTQTAKKLSALVPITEELLADNNVNLDAFIFQSVARAVAREEDNQAFGGSGSPFTGVLNASGVNSVSQAGANPNIDDIVNIVMAVAAGYRQLGSLAWVLDTTALKAFMKIKNDQGSPIWTIPAAGAPGTLMGYPYYETDVFSSKAIFGNFSHLWISDRGTYDVKASDSASDANGGAGSAFLQDEIWYKFRKRESIDVALAAAFAKMTVATA